MAIEFTNSTENETNSETAAILDVLGASTEVASEPIVDPASVLEVEEVAVEIVEELVEAEEIVDEVVLTPAEPSPFDREGDWYVVHTYAGYENKVKSNLMNRIRSMHVEERIFEVTIPMEDVIEFKAGSRRVVPKKIFPGYLLVRMDYDIDSWRVVRDTPGVTGFVGQNGPRPLPLSRSEVEDILGVAKPEGAAPVEKKFALGSSSKKANRCESLRGHLPTSTEQFLKSTSIAQRLRFWSISLVERLPSNSNSVRWPSSKTLAIFLIRWVSPNTIRR